MTNPKSVGRLPLTSCHESPASSLRITSQCFCMNRTFGRRRVHRDPVNAVADLGIRIGMYWRLQAPVDRPPGLAAVVGPECARGRDGDEDPIGIARVQQDRVKAQAAGPRVPAGPDSCPRKPGSSCHDLAAVGRAEQRRVFDSGVHRVGFGQRRLEMPHPLELPRVRRAVVPLVGARDAVVDELVADRLPRLAAVVGPLNHLAEPAAGLRGVEPVRVGRRAFEVVDLPAAEVRAVDLPPCLRLPSDVRTNAPLRVPTSTRTPLIAPSLATRLRRGGGRRVASVWGCPPLIVPKRRAPVNDEVEDGCPKLSGSPCAHSSTRCAATSPMRVNRTNPTFVSD